MSSLMNRRLERRTMLRGAGVALALPLLDAMRPAVGLAGGLQQEPPRRMFCICTDMGKMPRFFWPDGEGRDYKLSPYLERISDYRDDFTVFSGVSHPEVDGGHSSDVSYLTAAPHPSSAGFKNTISLDQFAAERIGVLTRFPSLSLTADGGGKSLSVTAGGVRIPSAGKPSDVFQKLFVQGSRAEIKQQIERLRDGRSVLDAVGERARSLGRSLGPSDRAKLDQYFTSVRELERRLVEVEQWEQKPKPVVDAEMPTDIDDRGELVGRTRLMYTMARLALETDSTRLITLAINQGGSPKVNLPGVSQAHHPLTHHGNREESIEQLKIIETAQMDVFGELLGELTSIQEHGETLLDRTMVLYGSNLGNANSHDNKNLPMILAGGGFKHGQHLPFDKQSNYPLPNLYVSMLQRLGTETDKFASSTGTLRGLEMI